MKCLGDFGALSPQERTRLREREPAMVKFPKANTIFYSAPVKPQTGVANAPVMAIPVKAIEKKPGIIGRFFSKLFPKKDKAQKISSPAQIVSSKPVAPKAKPVVKTKAPVKVKKNLKVAQKKATKVKAQKKVAVKQKANSNAGKVPGMSGSYVMGDFG